MKRQGMAWMIMVLALATIASAIGVVYTVDRHHRLVNSHHQLTLRLRFLRSQRTQLLLESSTLTSPVRIQNKAQQTLNMHQPAPNETRIIHAKTPTP